MAMYFKMLVMHPTGSSPFVRALICPSTFWLLDLEKLVSKYRDEISFKETLIKGLLQDFESLKNSCTTGEQPYHNSKLVRLQDRINELESKFYTTSRDLKRKTKVKKVLNGSLEDALHLLESFKTNLEDAKHENQQLLREVSHLKKVASRWRPLWQTWKPKKNQLWLSTFLAIKVCRSRRDNNSWRKKSKDLKRRIPFFGILWKAPQEIFLCFQKMTPFSQDGRRARLDREHFCTWRMGQ